MTAIKFIVDKLPVKRIKNLANYDDEPVPGVSFSIARMIERQILETTGWTFVDLDDWPGTPAVYPVFVRHFHALLSESKPFANFLPDRILAALQDRKILLAFIMADEGFEIKLNFVKRLRAICAEFSIPYDAVVIVSATKQHKWVAAARYNILDKALSVWSKTSLDSLYLRGYRAVDDPRYHFICLNLQPKYQRWHLLMTLGSEILNSNLVSCYSEQSTPTMVYSESTDNLIERLIAEFSAAEIDQFVSQLPLKVDDIKDFNSSLTLINALAEAQLYQQATIAVVTETALEDHPTNFITEKTFKPIAYRMPFIVAADRGFHASLVESGYRLFDTLFDYTFDQYPTIEERNLAIATQIKELCQQPVSQLAARLRMPDVQEVIEHNYRVLLSNRDTELLMQTLTDKLEKLTGCTLNPTAL
jgi:hypothetical protein